MFHLLLPAGGGVPVVKKMLNLHFPPPLLFISMANVRAMNYDCMLMKYEEAK